ncbi:phage major capsid protein [Diaphorobacter sp. HDW4A]|uniref:phage major capsid protein n=1 Tax=Diaphorobacter sp. HDW4A TaxID=2714924 RepID=UPI0014075A1B|nr:phage major capsid protein [Diaphorobacter sp. HDW4A]QIL78581.1 phage major capsid protein [Diaphorobacter sp. HDW4A]
MNLEELKPVLREFTDAANKKIDAANQRVKAVEESRDAIVANLRELEQHVAGQTSQGGAVRSAGHSVGPELVRSLDIDGLRSSVAKTTRAGLAGFFATRSAITSDNLPTLAQRDPTIYGPLSRPSSVRDLLQVQPTAAGAIEYVRGSRAGAAGIQANEGDAKAELSMSWTLETTHVRTIACWIPASRQILDDQVALAEYIDLELRDALRLTEDSQLLAGDGTGSNIHGLMTKATAYNRAQVGDKANDTMRRAVTQIQLARGVASGIVINPVALERLELEKDGEGRYLSTFAVTDSNGRTVAWRVPVVVSDAMTENGFLVGDFARAAKLYDRQEATVEVATQHADFFSRNLVAILAEERVALAVMRPDLLVRGEFAAP